MPHPGLKRSYSDAEVFLKEGVALRKTMKRRRRSHNHAQQPLESTPVKGGQTETFKDYIQGECENTRQQIAPVNGNAKGHMVSRQTSLPGGSRPTSCIESEQKGRKRRMSGHVYNRKLPRHNNGSMIQAGQIFSPKGVVWKSRWYVPQVIPRLGIEQRHSPRAFGTSKRKYNALDMEHHLLPTMYSSSPGGTQRQRSLSDSLKQRDADQVERQYHSSQAASCSMAHTGSDSVPVLTSNTCSSKGVPIGPFYNSKNRIRGSKITLGTRALLHNYQTLSKIRLDVKQSENDVVSKSCLSEVMNEETLRKDEMTTASSHPAVKTATSQKPHTKEWVDCTSLQMVKQAIHALEQQAHNRLSTENTIHQNQNNSNLEHNSDTKPQLQHNYKPHVSHHNLSDSPEQRCSQTQRPFSFIPNKHLNTEKAKDSSQNKPDRHASCNGRMESNNRVNVLTPQTKRCRWSSSKKFPKPQSHSGEETKNRPLVLRFRQNSAHHYSIVGSPGERNNLNQSGPATHDISHSKVKTRRYSTGSISCMDQVGVKKGDCDEVFTQPSSIRLTSRGSLDIKSQNSNVNSPPVNTVHMSDGYSCEVNHNSETQGSDNIGTEEQIVPALTSKQKLSFSLCSAAGEDDNLSDIAVASSLSQPATTSQNVASTGQVCEDQTHATEASILYSMLSGVTDGYERCSVESNNNSSSWTTASQDSKQQLSVSHSCADEIPTDSRSRQQIMQHLGAKDGSGDGNHTRLQLSESPLSQASFGNNENVQTSQLEIINTVATGGDADECELLQFGCNDGNVRPLGKHASLPGTACKPGDNGVASSEQCICNTMQPPKIAGLLTTSSLSMNYAAIGGGGITCGKCAGTSPSKSCQCYILQEVRGMLGQAQQLQQQAVQHLHQQLEAKYSELHELREALHREQQLRHSAEIRLQRLLDQRHLTHLVDV